MFLSFTLLPALLVQLALAFFAQLAPLALDPLVLYALTDRLARAALDALHFGLDAPLDLVHRRQLARLVLSDKIALLVNHIRSTSPSMLSRGFRLPHTLIVRARRSNLLPCARALTYTPARISRARPSPRTREARLLIKTGGSSTCPKRSAACSRTGKTQSFATGRRG